MELLTFLIGMIVLFILIFLWEKVLVDDIENKQ